MNTWSMLLIIALVAGGCTAIGWMLADVVGDAVPDDEPIRATACEAPAPALSEPTCNDPG